MTFHSKIEGDLNDPKFWDYVYAGHPLTTRRSSCPVDFCRKGCPVLDLDRTQSIEIFRASGAVACDVCQRLYRDHDQFAFGTGHVVRGCDGRYYHL